MTIFSSTPLTVTRCGVFQLALVNVSDAGDTVPSAVLELDRPITTFALGWLPSTTVKVAELPDSDVIRPDTGVTVMPLASLSAFVTLTSAGFWL